MSAFFDAEQPIIDRLKAKITAISPDAKVNIASAAVIGGSAELTALLPIMFVKPVASQVAEDPQDDDGSAPEMRGWRVVLVVKSLPDLKELKATYATLSRGYLEQIRDALIGWQPSGSGAALRYAGTPEPSVDDAGGWIEFPIDFKLPALVQAA